MRRNSFVTSIMVLLVLAFATTSFGLIVAGPEPKPDPCDPNTGVLVASGIADAHGTGGTAYVEYTIWKSANNDYYYYSYQVFNPVGGFEPYIKYLVIGNPTGSEYLVTSSSGGGPVGGDAWSASIWSSEPSVVTWFVGETGTHIYPGETSWDSPLFQFVSELPPASSSLLIRQGTPSTYANGLIPAPGLQVILNPRSPGYWKHQFSGKGKRREFPFLNKYMNEIQPVSQILGDDLGGNEYDDLFVVGPLLLKPEDSSDMRAKAERQLFALWLNVASKKLDYSTMEITFENPLGEEVTRTPGSVIQEVEGILNDAASTPEQIEYAKDLAEIINHLN